MADENETELEGQDGKGLRAQLERTIAERNALKSEVATMKAAQVIKDKGYEFVSVDDLKGADPDKVEELAQGLQQERADQFRKGLESRFRAQGLDGDALAAQVEDFLNAQPGTTATLDEQDAYQRARGVGGTATANTVPLVNPDRLSPEQKMELAFQQRGSSQKGK